MLDFLQSLFGGTEAKTQSTSQSSSQQGSFNAAQQGSQNTAQNTASGVQGSTSTAQNFNPFTSALFPLFTQMAGAGLPQFQGPTAAPMSGNEGSVLASLMGMQGQGGGVAGTNDYLSKVLSGSFLPGQPGANPFLEAATTAAQRTTMNNLTQTLSRSLPGYFTANGHMISPNDKQQGGSSAFDNAAAVATQGAANTMGDIAANIGSSAYNAERSNQQQAVGLSQQEVSNSINNLQAQALPRIIQQLGITNGLQLFQTNVQGLLQLLSTIGNVAGPSLGNVASSFGVNNAQGTSQGTSEGSSVGSSFGTSQSSSQSTGKSETQGNAFASLFPGSGGGGGTAAAFAGA